MDRRNAGVLVVAMVFAATVPCRAAAYIQAQPAEFHQAVPEDGAAKDSTRREPKRLVAAALALTLGPFGAHRLYMGTTAKVPVFYGLTFGGFGVLVLLDLGHILFTKDLDSYRHNGKLLMWSGGKASSRPTPP